MSKTKIVYVPNSDVGPDDSRVGVYTSAGYTHYMSAVKAVQLANDLMEAAKAIVIGET